MIIIIIIIITIITIIILLIKKLNAKRFLKHIYKKVNDVSALRYAIIKLRSEKT